MNNILILLSSIKQLVYTSVTNDQNVSNKISHMIHIKVKRNIFFKTWCYHRRSTNFNNFNILRYIITKNYCINEEFTNTV